MDSTIIIIFCVLLLLAYLFDYSSNKTRIPSVILLLLLGWGVRQVAIFLGIHLPDLTTMLPVLGTIGLILIVLEGSLELELNKSKVGLIRKSLNGAVLSMLATAFLLAFLFNYYGGFPFKSSLANAIPLSIISSSIAIPSVRGLKSEKKEFVIYESSLSDIAGVLFFNFVALNTVIDFVSFKEFGIQVVVISVVSFIATIGLSLLLSKIRHHIKFVPIILLILLIYAISKIYHLPALIFILVFGLFMGNLDELRHWKWIQFFRPDELTKEVVKFKEITVEAAFLIRALFFLLFGYLLETSDILNKDTLIWSVGIVIIIFVFRVVQLKLSKLPLKPLLFIAPRGLVTILLFLSILPADRILLVNNSLIVQVILISSFIMMIGLMSYSKKEEL